MFLLDDFDLASITTEILYEYRSRELAPLQVEDIGFVCPWDRSVTEGELMAHDPQAGFVTVCARESKKRIPPIALTNAVTKRRKEYRLRTGKEPSKDEVKRFKEEETAKLRKSAPVKTEDFLVLIAYKAKLALVFDASFSASDRVVSLLQGAMDQFRVRSPVGSNNTETVMTDWVAMDKLPHQFELGTGVSLKDPDGPACNYKKQDVRNDEITTNIDNGKAICMLGLVFKDFAFELHSTMRFTAIKDVGDELDADLDNIQAAQDEPTDGLLRARHITTCLWYLRSLQAINSVLAAEFGYAVEPSEKADPAAAPLTGVDTTVFSSHQQPGLIAH